MYSPVPECRLSTYRVAESLAIILGEELADRYQKFMLSLSADVHRKLARIADERRISIQELLRAIVVPEWLRLQGNIKYYIQTSGSINGEKELSPINIG